MLRDSNHGITKIIFESGFNNISWAFEQFKKKYGMTMSQYRKKRMKE
jgi:AraC-like DNA-binding protein